MATIEKIIGANLVRIRKSRGVSQMELGEKIGVSFQQIQKYEKGVTRISVSRLQQLAAALDVAISVLLQDRPKGQVAGPAVPYGDKADSAVDLDLLSKEEARLLQLFRMIGNKKIREVIIRQLQGVVEIEKPRKKQGRNA